MKHRREAGFTLIEIILGLILMGLLAAVGTSYMPVLQAPDATAEHEKLLIVARIAHTRNQAIIKDESLELTIISGGTALQYDSNMTPLTSDSENPKNELIVQLKDVTLTTSDCSSNCNKLIFSGAKGDYSYKGPSKIIITPTQGTPATLTISGAGYVD